MREELSYHAKMVMQAFNEHTKGDPRPGALMPFAVMHDVIPSSERTKTLNELLSELEFVEMLQEKFPGKLVLTHKGYHYIKNMKNEE
ncbi:MAG: hypothetical protein ACOCWZ_11070 [Spirochaetota bacterium]